MNVRVFDDTVTGLLFLLSLASVKVQFFPLIMPYTNAKATEILSLVLAPDSSDL